MNTTKGKPLHSIVNDKRCVKTTHTNKAGVVGVVVRSLTLHRESPGSAYRQFGFMPKMEVHTCYNSQKVTAASV